MTMLTTVNQTQAVMTFGFEIPSSEGKVGTG